MQIKIYFRKYKKWMILKMENPDLPKAWLPNNFCLVIQIKSGREELVYYSNFDAEIFLTQMVLEPKNKSLKYWAY